MDTMKIHALACRLYKAHGSAALAEAAHNAVQCEHELDGDQAKVWRLIEKAIVQMKGLRCT